LDGLCINAFNAEEKAREGFRHVDGGAKATPPALRTRIVNAIVGLPPHNKRRSATDVFAGASVVVDRREPKRLPRPQQISWLPIRARQIPFVFVPHPEHVVAGVLDAVFIRQGRRVHLRSSQALNAGWLRGHNAAGLSLLPRKNPVDAPFGKNDGLGAVGYGHGSASGIVSEVMNRVCEIVERHVRSLPEKLHIPILEVFMVIFEDKDHSLSKPSGIPDLNGEAEKRGVGALRIGENEVARFDVMQIPRPELFQAHVDAWISVGWVIERETGNPLPNLVLPPRVETACEINFGHGVFCA
jgi:hypothetical protein